MKYEESCFYTSGFVDIMMLGCGKVPSSSGACMQGASNTNINASSGLV